MPGPAFGFGIGDFVAVSSLIITICNAIAGCALEIEEFHLFQLELKSIKEAVDGLQTMMFEGTPMALNDAEKLIATLKDCKLYLAKVDSFISAYHKNGPQSSDSTRAIQNQWHRIRFTVCGSKVLKTFRARIQTYIQVLTLAQTNLCRCATPVLSHNFIDS
jgi:hypothetical protein